MLCFSFFLAIEFTKITLCSILTVRVKRLHVTKAVILYSHNETVLKNFCKSWSFLTIFTQYNRPHKAVKTWDSATYTQVPVNPCRALTVKWGLICCGKVAAMFCYCCLWCSCLSYKLHFCGIKLKTVNFIL